MASEVILHKLFQACKKSSSFAGKTDDQIWKTCLKYKDKSDSEIKTAIGNLRSKDWKSKRKSESQQLTMKQNKEHMVHMHEQETSEHVEDEQKANEVLEEFFNL